MRKYPKAIFFDLDDTLTSFNGVAPEAWDVCCSAFIQNYHTVFPQEITKISLINKIQEVKQWYWGDPGRHKIGRENLKQARREVIGHVLNSFKISDPALINDLADHYTTYQNQLIKPFPNTIATLQALKQKNIRMGVITNGTSQGQRDKLNRFDLTKYFEYILIDTELGFGKPDIRVFEHALSLFNIKPNEAWMVGDNPVWDIGPPQSLGIYAIWHDYQKTGLATDAQIMPDKIITNIIELIELIEITA